jgi:HK97 family phage portal protein
MAQSERIIKKDSTLQRTISWFTSLFNRAKTWRIFNYGTREVLPDINAEKAITEGYNANDAVYSIIKTDAEKFAAIPRYVADAKKLEEKRRKVPLQYKSLMKAEAMGEGKTKDALNRLLNRPNPYQGQAAFFKTVRSYYKTCGESFIWLNRGETDGLTDDQIALLPVLEMYPLPSYRMDIVPDPENLWGITGYLLDAGGIKIPFKKSEVIHWKDTNLLFDTTTKDHLRGMSPLKPGAATLQQNNDATHSAIRMYQNDGAKAAIYNKTLDKMTPTQETQMRNVIDRKLNNNDVKGAVAALQGEWGVIDLSKSSIDLDLLKGKEMSMMMLCFLFGVPYTLFDPNTAWANSEWQQKNWVSNRIMPASTELDDELNRVLLRAFALEGKFIIQCDYSQLPEMQADLKSLTEWLKEAWWIKPNERRDLMGWEKDDAEPLMDEYWIPNNLTPMSQLQGDGFDQMLNDLGVAGANDYAKPVTVPAKTNGQLNGAKTN